MLSLLQPGIPTWPIQTTNSSYQGISCYCSLLGVLKPSFFIFRIPYNTQLPCLTGFCMFCVFFFVGDGGGFLFCFAFPFSGFCSNHALTFHSSHSFPVVPRSSMGHLLFHADARSLSLHPISLSHGFPATLLCMCICPCSFVQCLRRLLSLQFGIEAFALPPSLAQGKAALFSLEDSLWGQRK